MSDEVIGTARNSPSHSLRDFYRVLFRHKWKMILFFLAVTSAVFVRTWRTSDVYRSEARLLVKLGRESVTLDPVVTTGQTIHVSRSSEDEVNLELEILRSRELAEKVVDIIGPGAFIEHPARKPAILSADEQMEEGTKQKSNSKTERPGSGSEQSGARLSGDRDRAVREVIRNLEVRAQEDSSIICIFYQAMSPELARSVIAQLIGCYLEKHIAVHQTPGSHEFFLQQCEYLKKNLELSENELREFRDERGISSLEDQRQVVSGRIAELEAQIGSAEAEIKACEAKARTLQETLADLPEVLVTTETTGFPDHAVDLMRAKLYELQLKEQDLVSRFSEESQQVRMVRKEVAEAQSLLDEEVAKAGRVEVSKGVNSSYVQIQSALFTEQAAFSSLKAKVENLSKQLTDAKRGLKALNEADLKISRLRREISIQETNYHRYLENLEQGRIDRELENQKISNIGVVQPATFPTSPVPQRKKLHVALGFLVGIMGSVGLAFFFEHIDHSIRTPEDVATRLQLPALASIPRVSVSRICPISEQRRLPGIGAKNGDNTPRRWQIPPRIRGHYSVFRDELLLKLNGSSRGSYVFGIIGCLRGEGVSTVAVNISAMLAQRGCGRVLLVDANVQLPSAHQIFNTSLEPGLVNILTADRDYREVIKSQRFKNLHILTAGIPNGNPPKILRPAQFARLIEAMKEDYRYVLLDLPPLKETRSVAKLASLCDGVILVVEAERLRSEVLLEAKAQLQKWNVNTLGVVLNKRRFHIPQWLYRTL